jgi:hypothetical protein
MNNEMTNEDNNSNENEMSQEKWEELLKAVYHNGTVALSKHLRGVQGQVLNFEAYGPVFIYHVKDESNHVYSCGFFLQELIGKFQSENDAALWMTSFYVDLMKNKEGKALPKPATNEEEAKALVDNVLVPQLIEAVREEFAPEQVHAGLIWNEEIGPAFEVGFPGVTEGNNVCAVPLHLLLTHYQLNRDPSELLLQGLYKIRKEHGLD